jgi:hypothetical protein
MESEATHDIPIEYEYEVSGDIGGHLLVNSFRVVAESEGEAFRLAIKELEEKRDFISTNPHLQIRKVVE